MAKRPTSRSGNREPAAPAVGPRHSSRDGTQSPWADQLRWVYMVLGVLILGLAAVVVVLFADLGWFPWLDQGGRGTRSPSIMLPDGTMVTTAPGDPAVPVATAVLDARALTVRTANARGDPAAPVVIIQYSDFQCPSCADFFASTEAQIAGNDVAGGKVRFAYKHLAILGQESIWAAQAAECAADQDRFWDYHDELFRRALLSGGKNAGTFGRGNLQVIAQDLQLDLQRFVPCLQNDETYERVRADTLEARDLGLSGTPSFLINSEVLIGAQPYATFARVVQRLATP